MSAADLRSAVDVVIPAVDVVVKVTLLLTAAALASWGLTRASAAARHQLWALAIIASLAMPVLSFVAPRWSIAVLPAPAAMSSPVHETGQALPSVITTAPQATIPKAA